MTIQEVVDKLLSIGTQLGMDVEVFGGTYYQDRSIVEVVIEDGYPLIVTAERHID